MDFLARMEAEFMACLGTVPPGWGTLAKLRREENEMASSRSRSSARVCKSINQNFIRIFPIAFRLVQSSIYKALLKQVGFLTLARVGFQSWRSKGLDTDAFISVFESGFMILALSFRMPNASQKAKKRSNLLF